MSEKQFPLNLVIGKIQEVKDHPNADKLYLLSVDIGEEENKQAVAGLKKHYDKETLEGKKAVFCTNIETANIRGEKSKVMILAAEDDDKNIEILESNETSIGEKAKMKNHENNNETISFNEFQNLEIKVNSDGRIEWNNTILETSEEKITLTDVNAGAEIK